MLKSLNNIGIVFMLVMAGFLGFLALESDFVNAGTTIYVDDDNTAGPWLGTLANPYQYIQDGVDAAVDSDTVYVFNGTYIENVVVGVAINLTGMNMANTSIDGGGTGNVVMVNSSWVNVTGFTITNGGGNVDDAGLKLDNVSYCEISLCNFSYNNGNGIYLNNSNNNTIFENMISNNMWGMNSSLSTDNKIYHNNFIDNTIHALDRDWNTWNMPYPTGGNYWSDWTTPNTKKGPTQNDPGSDRFVDLPRLIPVYEEAIMISEIMKDPSTLPDATGEWFEIYNGGTTTEDIDGWEIRDDGVDTHVINAGGPLTIAPGEHITLAISAAPGFAPDYVYSNIALSNLDDEIILVNGTTIVDRTDYDNGAIWPDPLGAAMELADYTVDNNDGSNWQVAVMVYNGDLGTPGEQNSGVTKSYDQFPFAEESGWLSSWVNKSAFPNYAPSGMPDFDQREKAQRTGQDYWMTLNAGPDGLLDSIFMFDDILVDPSPGPNNISIAPGPNHVIDSTTGGDDTLEFSYCGPTAAANALWWLDSRFADPSGTPGDGLDTFSLVSDYFPGDDHDPDNVQYLIEDLAVRFLTHNIGDTNASRMVDGLNQLFIFTGMDSKFAATNESWPDFPIVATEFENCNAVILFLGFYNDEGNRFYGHVVTMAGLDQVMMNISISDPIKNIANPIAVFSSYNDTANVSHDIYTVVMGPPHGSLPPTTWWLSPYTSGYGFTPPATYWAVVENVVYITPLPPTIPTEPLGLSAVYGDSFVNLTWSPPSSDGGSAITGYNIYRDGGFLVSVPASQLWYNDTSVTNGITYFYNVTAINGVGEGPNSTGISTTPMTVPTAPLSPGTSSGSGYVNLSWAVPSDDGGSSVISYNIYRNGTPGVYDTVPASQLWYNDTVVINGITYTYNISAVNTVGEGPLTIGVSDTPTSVPDAPMGLGVIEGNQLLNLSWFAPASDGGSPITSYYIYRNGTVGVYDTVTAGQLWYEDTNVSNGITYTYNVSAVNALGEGPLSIGVDGTPSATPTAPQGLAAEEGNGYVNLTWGIPDSDGGSPIMGYNIYRNGTVGVYAFVPFDQLWYNDSLVSNGITYTYNITAVNAMGEGANATISATPQAPTSPSEPLNVQVEEGNGYVNLSWDPPASNGGSVITDYNIYRNGTAVPYATVPAGQTWYNDTNVSNGVTYTYNVTGVNAIGEGPNSNDIPATPTAPTVPTEPLNLGTVSGDGFVNLTWDIPLSDGGSPITGYNIYRNDTPGILITVGAGTLWYLDTGVTNGELYTYNVSAVNLIGEGPLSDGALGQPIGIPDAPLNLAAEAGDGYVNLSWDAPFDGGSAITDYYIYRNGTPGAYFTVPATQLWFNDTNVSNDVTYTYNVSAVNGEGEGPQSPDVDATPILMALPSVPENPSAAAGDGYIHITWEVPLSNGGSAIIEYRIYRNDSTDVYDTVTGTQLWFNDTAVVNGETYSYNISAVNSLGEGPNATGITGTPLGVPSPPQNVLNDSGDGWINITWEEPASDGGSSITSYLIYRNGTVGVFATVSQDQLWFEDTDVSNGVSYTYNISAVNIVGEGTAVSDIEVTAGSVPDAPADLTAIPGNSMVHLEWDVPPSDGGLGVINYWLYRGTTPGGGVYLTVVENVLFYDDATVENGLTYYYTVSALNVLGEGPQSNEVSATPIGPPDVPTTLIAQPGDSYVSLSWGIPHSNGGSPITGYKIYRGESPNPTSLLGNVAGDILVYNDTTAQNDVTYYYRVTAVNTEGEGAYSNEETATPEVPGESENRLPTVTITSHVTDDIVNKTIEISGTASDPDGTVQKVEIKIGEEDWVEVSGDAEWSYSLNTKDLPNGKHAIAVRSYDGTNYSEEARITLIVNNPAPPSEKAFYEEGWFCPSILLLVIILIIFFYWFTKIRVPREKEEYEEEWEEEEEEWEEEEEEEEEPEEEEPEEEEEELEEEEEEESEEDEEEE